MKNLFFTLALFSLLLSTVSSTKAVSMTWNNTGTNFNAGASWSGATVPGALDTAVFATSATTQPNLSVSGTIFQLNFSAANSFGYNLTASPGASLTLMGNALNGSAYAITLSATSGYDLISAPVILGAVSGTQYFSAVGGGSLVISGPISSTNSGVGLGKTGLGTLFLMGANTYAGQTVLEGAAGATVINSIGNVNGGPSSLGAPTTVANGTIKVDDSVSNHADVLRYVGGVASTDRIIDLAGSPSATINSFTLAASGYGALTWNGNLTSSGTTTPGGGPKNVWLGGVSSASNTFAGSIQNSSGGANPATRLAKNGTGTWVLSGSNTFTGGLYVNGGTLTLDYQNGTVVDPTNALVFGNDGNTGIAFTTIPTSGGTLKLIGKNSGPTTQTLGNLTMYASPFNFNRIAGQSKIVIDPNGGAGTTLTLGSTWTRSTGLLYLDLPTGATLTSNPTVTNSLIGTTNNAGWAVVNDSTGLGFATVVGGNVVRYTGASALQTTSNSGTTNYKLSGNLTLAAGAHAMNSLDVNTTGGGTLNLSGTTTTPQSLLFTGNGDYHISGTLGQVYNLHQYSTGVVTIDALNTGAATTTVLSTGGPGTVALTTRLGTGALNIGDGAVRANGATVISAGVTILGTGGVLELGDIGNLTASLGTTGTGSIWFTGDGGFSAYDSSNTGVVRTVQLNGNTNSIDWGSQNFVPNDNALVLSNVNSNTTIDFQNGLNFGNMQHVVRVNDGSAAVDAKLSGTLSGVYGGGLIKEGLGTLSLTGNNTYAGETWVNAGTLLVNGNQSAATGAVKVAAGATLGGTGIIGGATTISGTHSPGNSPGIQTFASDLTYTSGASMNWELKSNTTTNAVNPNAIFDTVVVNGNLNFSGSTNLNLSFVPAGSDVLWSDSFWFTNHLGTNGWLLYDVAGTLTGFGNLSLVTINWLDSGGNAFDASLYPGAGFSLYQSGNDIYLNYAVPEPGTWLLVAVGMTTIAVFRRRQVALR